MAQEIRIDKWLWTVRLFKTRSLATEACKKGKVFVDNTPAKPSRTVKIGDIIQIHRNPVVYSFKVLNISPNRMGAKLVPEFMAHITTPDQLALIELLKLDKRNNRAKGTGRPTKKERRSLDEFINEQPFFIDEEWGFDSEI
ncbi:MAG TPA: RNA-binding S4 domain-containing protein [Paludibacteraceae bacterium]|nr:RNA-binding S4 domain-containing protein [Paludibacteraceae bacterium]HQB69688.1 RNA-binding S4 domain-containing protein [Paludibacteraceae bacterium]